MNSDIRIAVTFLDHLKTVKLKRRLGSDAVLCLVRLWFYTAQNRPDGVLTGMDDEDIEIAAKWEGEQGALFKSLIDIGWLVVQDGLSHIHDWEEHQPWVCEAPARKDKARRAAAARHAKDASSMLVADNKQTTSKQQASSEPAPFLSFPNQTNNTTCADLASQALSQVVVTIPLNTGDEYPIHENQREEWEKLFPAVDVPQELRSMRAWCLANPRNRKTRTGVLKFATSWLTRAQNRARKTTEAPRADGYRKAS